MLWLARRFRFDRRSWRRSLPVHVLAGLIISISWGVGHATLDVLFDPRTRAITFTYLYRAAFYLLDKELAIYWLIVLSNHVVDYYIRYREEELRVSHLEAQLAHAQLQALKMQLHPHFIFNTLHSISALLYKNPQAADRMLARLGDFLRLTLENAGAQTVTLREELEFLSGYLEIERVRFQDRLSTSMDIDPQTLDLQVPNLILQPLVENAIRHGIAPRSTSGKIEIFAERNNGLIRLKIRDNGKGLPTNRTADHVFKCGLGLANTQARLAQLYGDAYRIDLENDPQGGLVVTLEMPATTETADEKLQLKNGHTANGKRISGANQNVNR